MGFGFRTGLGGEDGVVTTRMQAEDDFGAGWNFQAEALGADGDATIVAGFDFRALAPNVGPPRTAWDGAQDGALFLFGGVPGLLRFHLEFAMDFVLVAVQAQGLHLWVGVFELGDLLAGEEGGEAVLPELMFAFDFALGLGRGGVAEGDAIEAEGCAELGEGVGDVGEEEGMKVHVEFQGQAAFEESGGEEVVIGEEGFALVEF